MTTLNQTCLKFFLIGMLLLTSHIAKAQGVLSGKIYDRDKAKPLEFVQVFNKTANFQLSSDKDGNYKIYVRGGDTVLFSALGFETQKLVIDKSLNFFTINIYMQTRSLSLPEVLVTGKKSYKADSISQREEYGRAYNYKDKTFGNLVGTAIFHPISFIEYLFQGKKREDVRKFQKRLINYEHEKFIDNYYNAEIVGKISKITDEQELNAFMKYSRPQYEFLKSANQYDLYSYIIGSYKKFKTESSIPDSLKKN